MLEDDYSGKFSVEFKAAVHNKDIYFDNKEHSYSRGDAHRFTCQVWQNTVMTILKYKYYNNNTPCKVIHNSAAHYRCVTPLLNATTYRLICQQVSAWLKGPCSKYNLTYLNGLSWGTPATSVLGWFVCYFLICAGPSFLLAMVWLLGKHPLVWPLCIVAPTERDTHTSTHRE